MSTRIRQKMRSPKALYALFHAELVMFVCYKNERNLHVTKVIYKKIKKEVFPILYLDVYVDYRASNKDRDCFLIWAGLTVRQVAGVGQMISDNTPKVCYSILAEMQALSDQLEVFLNMNKMPRYLFVLINATTKRLQTLQVKSTGWKTNFHVWCTSKR